MATAAISYTFTSGTTIVSDQVDQNFAEVVAFLNDETVHKDGSKTMTGALTLPNAEPSGSNVAVRRKSAYRGCVSGHPDVSTWTVAAGTSTSYATLTGDGSNNFGFTPDYDYTLIVLVLGQVFQTGSGQTVNVAVDAPENTGISVFGPATGNHWQWVSAAANQYQSISHVGRVNKAAAVVPEYCVRYKVTGLTAFTAWIVAMAYIVPQTRQSPT